MPWLENQLHICSSFLDGLKTPSLFTVSIAFGIPFVILMACTLLITPGLMNSNYHRLFFDRNSNDTDNFVTHQVFAYAEPAAGSVRLFGSSSTRESLVGDWQLENAIAEQAKRSMVVDNFANAGASFWEMAKIAGALPELRDGLILIEVRPLHFCRGVARLQEVIESPRLGFISPWIDEVAKSHGIVVPNRSGNYFWDNRRFFLARFPSLPKNLFDPIEFAEARHLAEPQVSSTKWTEQLLKRRKLLLDYDKNVVVTSEFLKQFIDRVRSPESVQVILLEATLSPSGREDDLRTGFWPKYQTDVQRLAEDCGVEYWDLNDLLSEADFLDWSHLRNVQAKTKFAQGLGARIASRQERP